MVSIVIPAHNEETVIGRCIEAIGASVHHHAEYAIYVVCNGCTDRTADLARGYAGVTVASVSEASKTAALNVGDTLAGDDFPRMYIDADVRVGPRAIEAVSAVLQSGEALAAAPRLQVALEGRPWIVRGFYRIFLQRPWVTDDLIGSGFYGLSREGRARFGRFPSLTNEDGYVHSLFRRGERVGLPDVYFEIQAPRTVAALVAAKARVASGDREFRSRSDQQQRRVVVEPGGLRRSLRLALVPGNWLPLLAVGCVRSAAKTLSRWRRIRHVDGQWSQDRTTRSYDAGAARRESRR